MASSDRLVGRLAYFTNAGPLVDYGPRAGIVAAVVGVHGSGRNARAMLRRLVAAVAKNNDDGGLLSSTTSAGDGIDDDDDCHERTKTKTTTANGVCEILVIAPWFLAPVDICPPPECSPPYLRWVDDAHGPLGIEHSFRYGPESIAVPFDDGDAINAAETNTISSYAAMDVLVETLCDRANYPDLERILVVGHSAGGQLVHRWGLTSGSWCFGDDGGDTCPLPSIRIVAANPRSYTYLDGRRYLPAASAADDAFSPRDDYGGGRGPLVSSLFDDLEFRLPTESELKECRHYNLYMWGLEENADLPAPYVTRNVERLMTLDSGKCGENINNADTLFCRYAARNVIYLSGERDTEKLEDQISKGDGYQGPTRRDRCERFYASLQVRGNEILRYRHREKMTDDDDEKGRINNSRNLAKERFHSKHTEGQEMRVHRHIIVKSVGHNGALMFQSKEGLMAMFG
ncbi:hypothetical protein ACHAW5_004206 [Stephanodiscus triporus]|uniref:Uncharacterized protein n=1 Tax=Stephanodiscus triporus TaxID=2934178 RepID=A0ABD3PSF1_9STRA